ncbi:MAG: GNAT family N-acetyltransferase [Flavobacterium sp.]|nr:GNAT family N-acetyltransferase [Flavobacterium sp.]
MEVKINSIGIDNSCISELEFNKTIYNQNKCNTYHISLYDDYDKRIGFGFFTIIPCSIAKINNIHILRKKDRRKGYATILYNKMEQIINQNCIYWIIGDAFEDSLKFWFAKGFRIGKFESNLVPIEKIL